MHAHTVLFFVEMFGNSVALGEPGTFLQWIYSLNVVCLFISSQIESMM